MQLAARSRSAQHAERVAQDHGRQRVVGRVESGVRQRDGARHLGEASADAAHRERRGEQQDGDARQVVPRAREDRLGLYAAAVSPGQEGCEERARHCQIPVLGGELHDEPERVVVVGEEYLVGRETLLRIAEIYRVGQIESHDGRGVDDHVVPIRHRLPPTAFAKVQRHERQQDERSVGVKYRYGVELERPAQQIGQYPPPQFRSSQCRQIVDVEYDAAEREHDIEQRQTAREQRGMCPQDSHSWW